MTFDIVTQIQYFRDDLSEDRISRAAKLETNPFDETVKNYKRIIKVEEEIRIQALNKIKKLVTILI